MDSCGDVLVDRTTEVVPGQLFDFSSQAALQASIVKLAPRGAPVAVYVAAVIGNVPEFPTVKNRGGYGDTPGGGGNVRTNWPDPYGADVFAVATAPHAPLLAVVPAQACAVLAASARVSEGHTSSAATAQTAAALPKGGAPTAPSFRWWWQCAEFR